MIKDPRRRVVAYEEQPNNSLDQMSRDLWPVCLTALLSCGHKLYQGVSQYRATRPIACPECGAAHRREAKRAAAAAPSPRHT